MLHKLLIALCLFITMNTTAQEKGQSTPAPQTPAIDYKKMGAPMPRLLMVAYHDTSAKKDTIEENKHLSKKERKRRWHELMAHQSLKEISGDDLSKNGNLFVMMFNPTCSHCEEETSILEKNIALFKKSELVLVANPSMKQYIPNFTKTYHTDQYPCMYVGTDSSGFIDNVFLYQSLPQINIYNTERKLIKTYTGDVPIDSLKKYIQ